MTDPTHNQPQQSSSDEPMSQEHASKLSADLRQVREEIRDFRRANRRSIWDGPAKLLQQFSRLFLPVLYFLGFMLVTVLVTAPEKLPWVDTIPTDEHVAFVNIHGAIASDKAASADRVIPAMEKAMKNKHSKALVLRINSPGGSPVQADRIYQAINELREKYDKPIIAVIADIGASGAYYLASAADQIYANPNSLVGSIGVISSSWGLQGVLDRFDVEHRVFIAGSNKDMLSPFKPVSPEMRKFWEDTLEHTHQVFIGRVKVGRGDRLNANYPGLFSGLIWNGDMAQKIGLIDGMGSMRSVVADRFDSLRTEDYTPVKPLGGLPGMLGISASDAGGIMASMVSHLGTSESLQPTIQASVSPIP